MKLRIGHVSNSSSSSFTIKFPLDLTYKVLCARNQEEDYRDQWTITKMGDKIVCSCSMNNFDLHKYCTKKLKIPEDCIEWNY